MTNECPVDGLSDTPIELAAYAGDTLLGKKSVTPKYDMCIPHMIRYVGPPRTVGQLERLQVMSPAGDITRVEVAWGDARTTNPIIVDDLRFQPRAARLTVTPAEVNVDAAPVTATIHNSGNVPVTIEDVRIDGTNREDFTYEDRNCKGNRLGVDAVCEVVVMFVARGPGQRTATLTVEGEGATRATVALTGTGPAQPGESPSARDEAQPSPSITGEPKPSPYLFLALALIGLLILGLLALGLILLARRLLRGKGTRRSGAARIPARVWVQPGQVTETIRMNGPDIAVSVVLDPTAGEVTWTARRQP